MPVASRYQDGYNFSSLVGSFVGKVLLFCVMLSAGVLFRDGTAYHCPKPAPSEDASGTAGVGKHISCLAHKFTQWPIGQGMRTAAALPLRARA
jgi:hypothetical protein